MMMMKGIARGAVRYGGRSIYTSPRRFFSTPCPTLRPTTTSSIASRAPSLLLPSTWKQLALSRTSPRSLSSVWNRSSSSDASEPRPLPAQGSTEPVNRDVPAYDLTFTCRPCQTRSTHRISKQGYHKGTVLITCPNCQNRHLIADHLKIFGPDMTIDKFLEQQGEVVKRGTLGPEGDIEIWDQNTDDPTTGRHVGAPYKDNEDASGKRE